MIKYFNEIKEASERYQLDPLMVASVVRAESNFNAKAVSPVGAKGLMQLMPDTDLWLDKDLDEFDVEGNLDNGCLFLDWLRKYFIKKFPALKNGHSAELWKIVWAGYNAGPGNIKKLLDLTIEKAGKDEAFKFNTWKNYLSDITGNHSIETINYVIKISKFWREYINKRESEIESDPSGSMTVSRQKLSCILMMVEGVKKELEQLVDQANQKEIC